MSCMKLYGRFYITGRGQELIIALPSRSGPSSCSCLSPGVYSSVNTPGFIGKDVTLGRYT